jgi:penicillin-insensitive murein endopeptidase
MLRYSLVALACALVLLVAPSGASPKQDGLPAKYDKAPYNKMSLSVGAPNRGRQLRAKRLRKQPFLRIKKDSRANVYGHPALVKMLYRTARDIRRSARQSVLLVGDLSSKSGGPLTKHRSHQSGRDADVAFYATTAKGKPAKLDSLVAFKGNGEAKDGSGLRFDDWRNWLLVQSWLRDRRAGISHIFVSGPLRARLLRFARKDKRYRRYADKAARLLKRPKDSSAHDDHFHLRISCPKRQSDICREESL